MPRVAKIKCLICGKGSRKSELICSDKKCHAILSKVTVKERQLINQLFGILEENHGTIWSAKETEAYRKPVIDKIIRSIKSRAIARSKDLIANIEKSLQEPSLHEEPIMPTDSQLTIGLPSIVEKDSTRRLAIGWPSVFDCEATNKPSKGLSKMPSFHEELHYLDDSSINENPLYEENPKESKDSEELLDYDDLIDDDPMDCN
jgi:predicted nucleic acid-binding Zn ribbon protein